jgi:hypothetical protein
MRRRLDGGGGRARGRGGGAGVQEAGGGAGEEGGWRWETSPTGGPHLSVRGRERRGEGGGRKWAGLGRICDGSRGWVRIGLICFFSFFFKSFFKPISNLLNSNLFHVFKLKI